MKQFKMPTAYAILTGLIVAVAIATWIIPAGQYDYVDGLPIAGSYHTVEANPQGIGAILLAPLQGFFDAVDVELFILMVGGFLGVVMETGAINNGVAAVVRKMRGRENDDPNFNDSVWHWRHHVRHVGRDNGVLSHFAAGVSGGGL